MPANRTESARACELCVETGGRLLWRDRLCRVVLVANADYPGFTRVVLERHVAEMTELAKAEQLALMRVVFAVEGVLRQLLRPAKINLASLGNLTPHLHWHVIPRFVDDRHFPQPIWASAQRAAGPRPWSDAQTRALQEALAKELAGPVE
jgi:diadenosine tetraphosphate (Ap4A) HIT family hydrolase